MVDEVDHHKSNAIIHTLVGVVIGIVAAHIINLFQYAYII